MKVQTSVFDRMFLAFAAEPLMWFPLQKNKMASSVLCCLGATPEEQAWGAEDLFCSR